MSALNELETDHANLRLFFLTCTILRCNHWLQGDIKDCLYTLSQVGLGLFFVVIFLISKVKNI